MDITSSIHSLNDLLWGQVLIYVLIAAGIYFTLASRCLQLRHFIHTLTLIRHSRHKTRSGISSFQALCTSLASRVGTGNLAGVAIAIQLGGPGAVFWMWLTAVLGMATSFVESCLAQVFKIKDPQGQFRGGPAFYMCYGLGSRSLGVVFSICLLLTYGFAFNGVQANSISESLELSFSIPTWQTGIFLSVLTGLVIVGGIRSIARLTEWVVPLMAGLYLLLAIVVVSQHLSLLPQIISQIIDAAWGWHQVGGGTAGFVISQAMMQGIKRGLFSNEAGMGSAPNIAATAESYPPHPATQGYIQMLGPVLDTLIICTCTAAIILLSGAADSQASGIALTQMALSHEVGAWANSFLSLAIFVFAFTTIIGNYAYVENNLYFLKIRQPVLIMLLRACVLCIVYVGATSHLESVWSYADLTMGCMALLNLGAILWLSPIAFAVLKDYEQQLKQHQIPTFKADTIPRLAHKIAPGVWPSQ